MYNDQILVNDNSRPTSPFLVSALDAGSSAEFPSCSFLVVSSAALSFTSLSYLEYLSWRQATDISLEGILVERTFGFPKIHTHGAMFQTKLYGRKPEKSTRG